MTLDQQARLMLPVIESELKRQIHRLASPSTRGFHELLAYHMGWSGPSTRKVQGGKRIRPLLTLLVCASAGGRWRQAAPGAAALELLHNFSLVHDDIQDNSPTRRGRPTLWRKAGVPLAINAGDALFTIANQATLDLTQAFESAAVVAVHGILQQACLDLTKGQFLDLDHQGARRLSLKGYWQMIDGKTAALLAACTHIGALLGGESPARCAQYRRFGQLLGLAFQVEDDVLGIWGEEKRTGKSIASDLAEGKLSLPVVYGLGKHGEFSRLWRDAGKRCRNAPRLRKLLEHGGGHEYATRHAQRLTRDAVSALHGLKPHGDAGAALEELSMQLLARSG
ncbi:MAG: polyprenyl synthetase family protein [Chloroflexota bacterium]